ncbi:hypothetical protein PGT21_025333 [Puccinia graminis f. sp. tritici]|uniref:Uncharacterized protein n=1 Tax=Puccinia graminis f. sp. tritici TaxID=56615 RepID=A0A5B0MVS4_PUCGR|nr:hypothetical protein PGT21_025333 [Puccinia graminis f. sp. tritici]
MYYETEAIEDDIRKFTYTVLRLRSKKAVVRVRDYLAGSDSSSPALKPTYRVSSSRVMQAIQPLIQNSLEWCEISDEEEEEDDDGDGEDEDDGDDNDNGEWRCVAIALGMIITEIIPEICIKYYINIAF